MKIYVVCRFNQARSIIGSAAIRNFYPEVEVISAGVEAQEGGAIPESVIAIAKEWDLPLLDSSSRKFETLLPLIQAEDLIIATDAFVTRNIRALQPAARVIGFQEVITEPELLAVDPATFGFDKLKLELAKSAAATLRIVEIFLRLSSEMNYDLINTNHESSHTIETIIPTLPAGDIEGKKTLLARARKEGKNILDASLRVSEIEEWREAGAKIIAFDKNLRPRDLPQELGETFTWENYLESDSIKIALQAGGLVFASPFELDDAPRILMSTQWRQLVRELAKHRPVLVLTPSNLSMGSYPDVALASWHGSAHRLNVN